MDRLISTHIRKPAYNLLRGDKVHSVPYAGGEQFPLTVIDVVQSRQKGSVILIATDANGRRVQVPLGHNSNFVEVER